MRCLSLALVAASALAAGCVFASGSGYHATTVSTPPSFDQSWGAALGAANDVNVEVTGADRASGRITGTKAGVAVTIDLLRQADNNLKVVFSAPESKESNPSLGDRWMSAYNRRLGR